MEANRDYLAFGENKEIKKLISNEAILFSDKITKINQFSMYQDRNLLITDAAVYNFKKMVFKRRIELKCIKGITISIPTDEFVIHGLELEYDINYISSRRNELLEVLAKAYKALTGNSIKFCQSEAKSLKNFVTTIKEKKKDIAFSRMNELALSSIDDYFAKILEKQSYVIIDTPKRARSTTLFSHHKTVKTVSLEDFHILKVLGRGTFGKVCLVEYQHTKEIYAMKSLKKDVLLDKDQIENTLIEKKILQTIDYPFLVGMVFCFQTEERLYFVMPFCRGGELFQHLRKNRFFEEGQVKFYASIIGLSLGYLHSKGVIYRDIKPENILMDDIGYLKLADFGLAKILKEHEKATSFCGTHEYLAPEIISGVAYNFSADWWSFGILVYEMLCGIPPFYSDNISKMYELIQKGQLRFPKRIIVSDEAKDLLTKLLNRNTEERMGSKEDFNEIMKHPFFADVDFDKVLKKEYDAPFKPTFTDEFDLKYFDAEFTNEEVVASVIPERKLDYIKLNQDKFEEFNH